MRIGCAIPASLNLQGCLSIKHCIKIMGYAAIYGVSYGVSDFSSYGDLF